jgi:GT2 family glycosyltransferase
MLHRNIFWATVCHDAMTVREVTDVECSLSSVGGRRVVVVLKIQPIGASIRLETKATDDNVRKHELVGVLLDGHYIGSARLVSTDEHDASQVEINLPDHTIADELDLVDIVTGDSLLRCPVPLSSTYEFRMLAFGLEGDEAVGRFTVHGLPSRLWMSCEDERRTFFRGFAVAETTDNGQSYSFRLPILFLVPPNEPSVRQLRVAGKIIKDVILPLEPSHIGYVGFVDVSLVGFIVGWALNLRTPADRVQLDLMLNGQLLTTILANEFRDDLRVAGISDGASGFQFDLSQIPGIRDPQLVSVLVSGTRLELCNSPVIAIPRPSLRGSFDTLHGLSAHGWALDDRLPSTPVAVEAICEGKVLATSEAKLFRSDLLEFGLNGGFCAFKIDIGSQILDLIGKEIFVRVTGTGVLLEGSPKIPTPNPNTLKYLRDNREVSPDVLDRLRRFINYQTAGQLISIIMPVYNTPQEWLIEAIGSVCNQWCDQWELICIDDCSDVDHVHPILSTFARRDPRIRLLLSPKNIGIAKSVNLGLRIAKGEYITFLDHDDYLEPDAVYHLLRATKATRADFIYSDEVLTEENIQSFSDIKARPAFSYDFYLSHPYFVHMLCLRREVVYKVGGWDEKMAISADVDFVLRCLEVAETITHVPRVLYRWRTHGSSTGHSKKDAVMEVTRGAIQRHLNRCHTGAIVEDGVAFNQFRVNWPDSAGRVLIVIPTKNKMELVRGAIDSIERTCPSSDYKIVIVDHDSNEADTRHYLEIISSRHIVMPYSGDFNYSRINNLAVEHYGDDCAFVLFLNNDVEATQSGWISRMRSIASREDVGAVGALLLYPDNRIQHAGVILGFNGSADHAFKFEDAFLDASGRRNLGHNCSLTSLRDYSAVTAACLMMRTTVFRSLNGFDETFGVGFNDTDLCLRVRELGLKVLYDGATILYHFESATRSENKLLDHPEDTKRLLFRHQALLEHAEPFYNPNLSHIAQDHVVREDGGCKQFQYRTTSLIGLHSNVRVGSKKGSEQQQTEIVPRPARRPRNTVRKA